MPCEQYVDLILDSLEGSLHQEQQCELNAHLETCEACRSLYDTYHNIDAALSSMEEPPAELKSIVMGAISKETQTHKKAKLKRYRFTAIAACAAIAIMIAGRTLPKASSTGDAADNGADQVYVAEDTEIALAATGAEKTPQTMEETSKDVVAYDGGGPSETVYIELSEAGLAGKLMVITPEYEELVVGSEMIELPSGYMVYHISSERFSALQPELGSYEELLLPGEDTGEIYIMIS